MSDELKPCPFCGSPSVTTQARHPSILPYFVECSTCDARGARREGREAAITAWNNRPIEDKLQARIAKLEADLKEADEVREILEGLTYHITDGRLSKVYPLDTLKALYDDDMMACVERETEHLRERIDALEWLREVEEVRRTMREWHPDKRKKNEDASKRRDNAWVGLCHICQNARAAVES